MNDSFSPLAFADVNSITEAARRAGKAPPVLQAQRDQAIAAAAKEKRERERQERKEAAREKEAREKEAREKREKRLREERAPPHDPPPRDPPPRDDRSHRSPQPHEPSPRRYTVLSPSPPGSVKQLKKLIRGLKKAQAVPGQDAAALAARAQEIDGYECDLDERQRKKRKYGSW